MNPYDSDHLAAIIREYRDGNYDQACQQILELPKLDAILVALELAYHDLAWEWLAARQRMSRGRWEPMYRNLMERLTQANQTDKET